MRRRNADASRLLVLLSVLRAARRPVRQSVIPGRAPDPSGAGLRLRLQLPEMVPTGSRLPFGITVTNTTERPLPLRLKSGGPAYEVEILEPGGRRVHTLSGGRVDADRAQRTLEPGATLHFEGQWDQRDELDRPVPPARYDVRVTLRVAESGAGWESITRTLAIAP